MTWNYRVMRNCHGEYEIREVFYGADGSVEGWTDGASYPLGETFRELMDDALAYYDALNKPVLDAETGKQLTEAP